MKLTARFCTSDASHAFSPSVDTYDDGQQMPAQQARPPANLDAFQGAAQGSSCQTPAATVAAMTLQPSSAIIPARKEAITIEAFSAVDMRAGTIVSAALNPKARKPAYVLEIDLGALGMVKSSAQLVDNYQPDELVGRRVVVVANLPARKVAGVKSEVLVLASVCPVSGTKLLDAADGVSNGACIA